MKNFFTKHWQILTFLALAVAAGLYSFSNLQLYKGSVTTTSSTAEVAVTIGDTELLREDVVFFDETSFKDPVNIDVTGAEGLVFSVNFQPSDLLTNAEFSGIGEKNVIEESPAEVTYELNAPGTEPFEGFIQVNIEGAGSFDYFLTYIPQMRSVPTSSDVEGETGGNGSGDGDGNGDGNGSGNGNGGDQGTGGSDGNGNGSNGTTNDAKTEDDNNGGGPIGAPIEVLPLPGTTDECPEQKDCPVCTDCPPYIIKIWPFSVDLAAGKACYLVTPFPSGTYQVFYSLTGNRADEVAAVPHTIVSDPEYPNKYEICIDLVNRSPLAPAGFSSVFIRITDADFEVSHSLNNSWKFHYVLPSFAQVSNWGMGTTQNWQSLGATSLNDVRKVTEWFARIFGILDTLSAVIGALDDAK